MDPIYIDSISEESSSEEDEDGADFFEQFTDSWSSSDSDSIKKIPSSGGVAKKSGNKLLLGSRMKQMSMGGVKGRGKRSLSQSFEEDVNAVDMLREGKAACRVLPEGWNGQELTVYRMLQNIFGHNYCAIAQLIQTKTCQQVHCCACVSCDCHVTLM